MGILTPIKYMVPWAHPSRYSERHHDRFRHLCRAHGRDRQTDRPRYNVCSNRPHLASVATIITSGQSNFTQGRIAAAYGRFSRIRQCAPCKICFHQPTRVLNPNGISIDSAIFVQLTAECRRARPFMSFPLKIVPSHGDVDFRLIHASLGSPESITQTASRSVQSGHALGHALSPQNCPFPWGIWTPSITWFLWSSRFSIPDGM